ncbi:MAG: hypothetical protein ACI82I_000713, partial [Gammaproteobacteria bacterium]
QPKLRLNFEYIKRKPGFCAVYAKRAIGLKNCQCLFRSHEPK